MEKEENILEEKPPFFSNWKKLYVFIIAFEVVLMGLFYWMTVSFN